VPRRRKTGGAQDSIRIGCLLFYPLGRLQQSTNWQYILYIGLGRTGNFIVLFNAQLQNSFVIWYLDRWFLEELVTVAMRS
jgi:hypothetical protein